MTPDRLNRHRAVLAAHKAALDEDSGSNFSFPAEQFDIIRADIDALHADCPGLVPPFDTRHLIVNRIGNVTTVGIAPVRSYLARAVAILETHMPTPATRAETKRGFFSHAASDKPLADHVRAALQQSTPGVEYFMASHRGHIPPGDSWCGPIFTALRTADRFVILLTPTSVRSPWVAFETGVAWMPEGYPLAVLCVGLEPRDVPTPFAELQVSFLDGPGGRDALLAAFERVGSRPPEDVEGFLARLRVLADSAAVDGMAEQGFTGLRVGSRFVAWEGPFDDLQDQPGARLRKPDLDALVAAIREEGLEPAFGHLDRLGSSESRQVFSVSPKGWKRPILYDDGRQVLVVKTTPIDPTVTEKRARDIIEHVTGRTPIGVEVEPMPAERAMWVFREESGDGRHRHLFHDDASTGRSRWREALQEVCWRPGCRETIDPAAPVTRDTNGPASLPYRLCSRHGLRP